jgi:hypothetical protein
MTRKPIHTILLIAILLWCALLVIGSFLWAFMGMLFAGEPAGGGIGLLEFLTLSAPFLQTAILSFVLITLWRKGFYLWAFITCLLSVVYVVYTYHGWLT